MNRNRSPRLGSITRSLRYRNFRLFFVGQSISLIGTWMQRIAVGWLVYRMTDSAFLLGMVGFAGQIPIFALSPLAGVIADRWDRHRLLIWTQVAAMAQALVLAFLVLSGTVQMWHVIGLSLALGAITAFDVPVRQAFMIRMIEDRKDLGNAIALNSSMVNLARLLGPTAAGLLIAVVGEGMCFLINGLSYLAVIASLLMMTIDRKSPTPIKSNALHDLRDGLSYVFGFEPIRAVMMLVALVSLTGLPYLILMPIFARDILHEGPRALGFLMGGAGMGALAGALWLASRKGIMGLGKMLPIGAAILGLSLLGFALSRNFALSLALAIVSGFGQMTLVATSNTLLQTLVDENQRGRVMSYFSAAFLGMAPFGALLAGSLAGVIGADWTVFAGGVSCLLGAAIFARKLPGLREQVRPMFATKGIVPEVAQGIECAADGATATAKR